MKHLVRRARPAMGTLVGIATCGDDPNALDQAIHAIFAEIERLEGILSEWRPDSAVSRVNLSAGDAPVRVPGEVIEVLQVAAQVSLATDGAFDATWAPLAELWKLDEPGFRPPTAELVATTRERVGHRDVVLDPHGQTVFLRRPGMRLGLGGIAKAHIAERAAELAVASGVPDVLIDAGGDVVARGRHGERPWTVGIRAPRARSSRLATVELHDEAVVTSGDYEHFVEVGGRRYHHLLDPRTGFPASASQSATVIAPRGALADALSTGLFILGVQGLDLVARNGRTAALLVDRDGVMQLSEGAARRFATA